MDAQCRPGMRVSRSIGVRISHHSLRTLGSKQTPRLSLSGAACVRGDATARDKEDERVRRIVEKCMVARRGRGKATAGKCPHRREEKRAMGRS